MHFAVTEKGSIRKMPQNYPALMLVVISPAMSYQHLQKNFFINLFSGNEIKTIEFEDNSSPRHIKDIEVKSSSTCQQSLDDVFVMYKRSADEDDGIRTPWEKFEVVTSNNVLGLVLEFWVNLAGRRSVNKTIANLICCTSILCLLIMSLMLHYFCGIAVFIFSCIVSLVISVLILTAYCPIVHRFDFIAQLTP